MPKKSKPSDLFAPLVPLERLHAGFNQVRTWNGAEPARLMMNEVYRDFPDQDGNFAEQFQTAGFDARTFELYLFAYLASSGFGIHRNHPSPDFIVTSSGTTCAIEATTVNPTGGARLVRPEPPKLPAELSPEALRRKIEHELPIRFGSPLKSKIEYRDAAGRAYWQLEHCRDLPFVLAIEAFHEFGSLFFTSASLSHYLYGLKWSYRRTEAGELIVESAKIDEHRSGPKVIPSGFFGQPNTEYVSAVLFSNTGTYPKFNRMGYQAGYHRGNITLFRRGTCFDPDPKSATPREFAYDLNFPPCEEWWGQLACMFLLWSSEVGAPRSAWQDSPLRAASLVRCALASTSADGKARRHSRTRAHSGLGFGAALRI